MKLKRILISQPKPESEKSPWLDLPIKHKVSLDFKPFICVEGISGGEFRKQKIDVSHYNCIILNSRNAVDHYFRMVGELRYSVPEKAKYFCLTEAVALYLQKYIQYRKRKIFFAQQNIDELAEPIRKNKEEKFLFVCSDKATDKTSAYLDANKINYARGTFYRTVCTDMKSVDVPGYEMIIFFSPTGIESLFENYPDFKQGNIRIGVFGPTTYAAAVSKGLRVDLAAPLPNAPSMTMALDLYIKEFNAKNGEVKPMVSFPTPILNNGTIDKQPVEKTIAAINPIKITKEKKVVVAKKPVLKKVLPKKEADKKAIKGKEKIVTKKGIAKSKKEIPLNKTAVVAKTIAKKAASPKKKAVVVKKKAVLPKKKVVVVKKKVVLPKKKVVTPKKKAVVVKKKAVLPKKKLNVIKKKVVAVKKKVASPKKKAVDLKKKEVVKKATSGKKVVTKPTSIVSKKAALKKMIVAKKVQPKSKIKVSGTKKPKAIQKQAAPKKKK